MELSRLEMLGGLILEAKLTKKEAAVEFARRDMLRSEAHEAEELGFKLQQESYDIMARAEKLADEILEAKSQVTQ